MSAERRKEDGDSHSPLEQFSIHPFRWLNPKPVLSSQASNGTNSRIREGRSRHVGQCLIQDYRLCLHVLSKELSKDFFEGCRALLVDKDKNPKWEPSKLETVDDETINAYFSKVDEDLKLPEGQNSRVASVSKL